MSEAEQDPFAQEESRRGPRDVFGDEGASRGAVVVKYDVFSVFRPWQVCRRCQENFDPEKSVDPAALPDEGDIVCPHTRRAEYVALLNRCRTDNKSIRRLTHTVWSSQATGERFAEVSWEEYGVKKPTAQSKKEPKADPEL